MRTRLAYFIVLMVVGVSAAATTASAQGPVAVEALAGKPFGVGRIEVQIPESLQPEPLGLLGLSVSDQGGRVFYPAIDAPALGQVVKGILEQAKRPAVRILGELINPPPKATVYFLFQGDAPLDLTLRAQTVNTYRVVPMADATAYSRVFAAWWRAYTAAPGLLRKQVDYPPLVEDYLQAMLARRLGLPLQKRAPASLLPPAIEQQMGPTIDPESALSRLRIDRMMGRTTLGEKATLPVPNTPVAAELAFDDGAAADAKIEPLALRVPIECFYVRFGSFTNFLWFQDTLARWGGDLRNLMAQRGLDYQQSQHMERQLALHQTALSRLLGEAVVADAAIIGSDMDLIHGAAIGILFYARNSLMGNDITRQRQEALKSNPGTTERKLTVDGHSISFLSSPDGSVRSFYVADGSYHLVTTSETLARRFLAIRSGEGALGTSKEFRHARSQMPTNRNDTVFVYLSSAFFRNLTGPQYRIETLRRLQATADVDLVQLARLTSATEGKPADSFQQLIEGGFLPPDFGPRPDGSQAVMSGGQIYDSLRGDRGSMVPVPDVPVDAVSSSEAESYQQFAESLASTLGPFEPLMAGMRRVLSDDRTHERVTIDFQMSPLNRQRYASIHGRLGQADNRRLTPLAGDVLAAEVITDRQRMFGGLRDYGPTPERMANAGRPMGPEGLLAVGRLRDLLVGYLGYVGNDAGWLELLNRRIGAPPDPAGFASSTRDLFWRRQFNDFTVFSFHSDVLAAVTAQLRFQEAPRPAQIRLYVGDLSHARLAPVVDKLAHERSRQTSLGNLRLLHAMVEQLHVPAEDAKDAAELLLGARLVDPLGAQYVYQSSAGMGSWSATTLQGSKASSGLPGKGASDSSLAPPLNWFRGLDFDALLAENRLTGHAEIEVQLPTAKK